MREHELRRQVVSEMHLRRWPLLSVPGTVVQWVLVTGKDEREAELAFLDSALPAPADNQQSAHRSGEIASGVQAVWERHSEGSSLALFAEGADADLTDAMLWAQDLPGRVVRATRITLVKDERTANKRVPAMDFTKGEVVSCKIGGKARIWADFRLKDDGFGHIIVAANGMDQRDFTRTVQRLQELGNYRNKALLGLPAAQSAWPVLDAAEARLADLSGKLVAGTERDDELMSELSALSLEISGVAASTGYRMSATRAYAQLVQERLDELQVEPLDGFASLITFTKRRFLPAVRFCDALVAREEQLSERAGRLGSLLRARIETRIENQNAKLMRSMDRSASLQLRLQQLVEGLSVVALSYYLLSLIKLGLHAVDGIDSDLVVAWLVIPTVLLVWFGIHAAKKRLLGQEESGSER